MKSKRKMKKLAKQEELKKEQEEVEEIVEDINDNSEEVASLKAEIEKLKNDYARAYADTENVRKRLTLEAEQNKKYSIQNLAKELLPVIDNLERALKVEVKQEDKSFYDGVMMTYNQLMGALKKEGVEEVDCLNKPFDPNLEQAIMQEKVEGKESGIVIEVLQKGYVLKDRILRAAMVKVSE